MPSQLDQLLAYLDRPGVSELTFCVGKPITMRTEKGVMNVTGRALGSEQMAGLLRGTPLEALVADDTAADKPVQLAFGERDVEITVERAEDPPTLKIARLDPDKPRLPRPPARTRRSKASDRPPSHAAADAAPAADAAATPDAPSALDAPALEPPAPEPPALAQPPAAIPAAVPVAHDPILDIELPPPRTKAPSVGPPGIGVSLDALGPAQGFDIEPAVRPSGNKPLRIDIRKMTEPPPMMSGDLAIHGIIPKKRPPSQPLPSTLRSLEVLGLPHDVATTIARDRGLVLITAPHGHGKTSTLAALFDRIDRGVANHVVTIDELRDRESTDLALTTAESGYFVLATLTAPSPRAALDTLLDSYPGMAHGRVKTRLASALVAVIAKRLPPTPSEILVGPALKTLLGD